MKKYSKAVSEMYSQSKQGKNHPLKKYAGRYVRYGGWKLEVVGYYADMSSDAMLIVNFPECGGWPYLKPHDVVFKECESYLYAGISNLID